MSEEKPAKIEISKNELGSKLKSVEALGAGKRKLLMGRSKEELVDIIMGFETNVRRDSGSLLSMVGGGVTFDTDVRIKDEEYIKLPRDETKKPRDVAKTTWRLLLISSNTSHRPLGLEIWGDIMLGRRVGEMDLDVDFSAYDAGKLGISRKHALLRPTNTSLFVIDQGSTNGTFVNAIKLGKGVAQKVNNGDTISFGGLHFILKIIDPPK